MPSTHKKVVVRKLDRDAINGFVSATFVVNDKLEMLNTSGNVVAIDLKDIKSVSFVRDFADSDEGGRKTFATRPRVAGLWVRLKFRDHETMEGMLPSDLAQMPAEGYLLNPPDARSNIQRIFVPRAAVASMTVLAVIGGERRRRRAGPAREDQRQVPMFTE